MHTETRAPAPAEYVSALRDRIDRELQVLVLEREPRELYDPVRYILAGKGKRLRPILLMLAAGISGADEEDAFPAALATEVFHNFTLVHDDIMDNADERRGRPTVHVKWDESTAILTGDYLYALAYDLLTELRQGELRNILRAFNRMVVNLCEGQTLDKVFEGRHEVSVDDYFDMIYAKTAALIECAMEVGGYIGGAGDQEIEHLRSIGRHLGRAFQVQDDLLDLVANDERWGKSIGGDLEEGKKTYLLLRALELAEGDEHAWFARIVERPGLAPDEVDEARDRMRRLGVLVDAERTVEQHYAEALRELEALPESVSRNTLASLIDQMRQRGH